MSYARKNLIPGENIVYQTRLHWVVLIWHLILALLFLVAPAIWIFYRGGWHWTDRSWIGVILLITALIVAIVGMVQRNGVEMAVTNKRVLIKQGVFNRRTLELLLQKVESISVDETLGGRMLGFGTVTVCGTGGTPEPFRKIAHPLEFRRQVEQQIAALPR